MLKSISLKNFRGFSEHKVELGKETILIGRNNAGKTTVVEALRVISVCQARALTAAFTLSPDWVGEHCQGAGFKLSLDIIDFDFANVQHAYDTSEPAVIKVKLNNNNEIHIYIGKAPSEIFCQLRKGQRNIVTQRTEVASGAFGSTKVMPPVGSLLPREKAIAKDRLKRFLDGYLAYRHFRNQLWEKPAEYRLFLKILESTWQNLQIQHFENDHGVERNEFSLLIREGKFTSEISWHGHGLQAWAQTIWFLSRINKNSTVVLDEPDVYLHADLQRKLIKVIESIGFKQSIIATHSPEIISDVPFGNVVVVQKRERFSKPAAKASEIQASLRGMGSIHSIQLSKLAEKGLVLFVEGDDKLFLSDVAFKMGAKLFDNFAEIAVHEIKGKGNWQQALGASEALQRASEGEIEAALLLDGDYMLNEERLEYFDKAHRSKLWLTIWSRKEIENYFVIPAAISRYINANCSCGSIVLAEDICTEISVIERELTQDLLLSYAGVISKIERALDPKASFNKAQKIVDEKVSQGFRLVDLLSGKEVLSRLSKKFQSTHQVSFGALSICKEVTLSEFDSELTEFISHACSRACRKI